MRFKIETSHARQLQVITPHMFSVKAQ